MRLGGPIFDAYASPEEWVAALRAAGYRAAYCPVGLEAATAEIRDYAAAAAAADIVIAEVGAWSSPLSPDDATRRAALERCTQSLALADEIGARCCVNVAGSRGEVWHGPCALDLTEETFGFVVETVREIIDSVRPRRTCYTLETMPWMVPDSAEAYLRLLAAVDRPAFAVHFDPVNLINSPRHYFRNAEVIREFVDRLGPWIKSCHAKDILLQLGLSVRLDEVRPGRGGLDYRAYLNALAGLEEDLPLMLEHLPNAEEYAAAAVHIREVGQEAGVIV